MHYTYVLRSEADGRFYIGATNGRYLRQRISMWLSEMSANKLERR